MKLLTPDPIERNADRKNTNRATRAPRLALCIGVLLAALPALGHHGFSGRYDTERPQWIEGVITGAQWAPPHPVIELRVSADERPPSDLALPSELTGALIPSAAGRITVEFPPVSTFFALRDSLKLGDRVALIALRNCEPPHQLRSQWVRLPSGSVVSRSGRLSTMVSGCGRS
jgi:hypothetical protein